jgi:glycerophosphoryl diester phosphodiesterase
MKPAAEYVRAHRGVGKNAFNKKYGISAPRENTLASFHAAQSLGVNTYETDLRRLRSGQIVCFHDYYFNKRRISSYTLEELKTFIPDILTLEELLRSVTDSHIILELKYGEDYKEIIDEVRSRFRTLEGCNTFSWISFDERALELAKGDDRIWIPTCMPHVHMLPYRVHPYISAWDLELAQSLGISQIAAHPLALTQRVTYNAQNRFGLQIGAQVNDSDTTERMWERGVRNFYTDNIPVVVEALVDLV